LQARMRCNQCALTTISVNLLLSMQLWTASVSKACAGCSTAGAEAALEAPMLLSQVVPMLLS
jgi:hypothetical protein